MRRQLAWDCVRARRVLARLAVGGTLGEGAAALAGHVRWCPGCDAHVDQLATLRRWLGRQGAVADVARDDEALLRDARAAVVRELEARLARDLAPGLRDPGRPAHAIEDDVRRCALLRDASTVPDDVWRQVCAALARRPRGEPRLELATRLDPVGLDLTLAWLAQLARRGRHDHARREARAYLARLEGVLSVQEDR